MRLGRAGWLILAWASVAGVGIAHSADAPPLAVGARIEQSGDSARLVFDLSTTVVPRAFVLADPNRVIVDLPEVNFQIDPEVGRLEPLLGQRGVGKPRPTAPSAPVLVTSFRFGLFAAGRSRVVIDVAGPVRIVRAVSEPAAGGARLTVELAPTDRAAFLAAAASARGLITPTAAPSPPVSAAGGAPDSRPVIVLDAGHGGVDTGALGLPGVVEKDITLAFATALSTKLQADGRYRVVLTRASDAFVPLGERVRVARAANASLFISIHADTVSDAANVAGATVYTASDRASDAEAARVAEKENQADAAAGLEKADDRSDVSDILFDLTRRETRSYGHIFARSLISVWKGAGRLNKNPERAAGFVVLKAPDVPSVLLELGYLSNPQDSVALSSQDWRDKATASVARAIETFFAPRLAKTTAEATAAEQTLAGLRRE